MSLRFVLVVFALLLGALAPARTACAGEDGGGPVASFRGAAMSAASSMDQADAGPDGAPADEGDADLDDTDDEDDAVCPVIVLPVLGGARPLAFMPPRGTPPSLLLADIFRPPRAASI